MSVREKTGIAHDESAPELSAISRRLVAARMNAEPLPAFPGELPRDLEGAYAVQAASMAVWPDEIAGWKVGMVPESFRGSLDAERLAGPIFKSTVFDIEPGGSITMPIFEGGFAAVEAEFVFRLKRTVEPAIREWSDQDLVDVIGALHVGAEIASSPMAEINNIGPCCVVSDFGNNAGLVVGPDIPDWRRQSPDSLTVAVTVDGVIVGTSTAGAIEGGLLQALRFLLRVSAARGLTLAEGTYVSCGAVTGIHDVTVDSKATVDFGAFGAFDVSFEAMRPHQAPAASSTD